MNLKVHLFFTKNVLNLVLKQEEKVILNKYGRLRSNYLKEHNNELIYIYKYLTQTSALT